ARVSPWPTLTTISLRIKCHSNHPNRRANTTPGQDPARSGTKRALWRSQGQKGCCVPNPLRAVANRMGTDQEGVKGSRPCEVVWDRLDRPCTGLDLTPCTPVQAAPPSQSGNGRRTCVA